MLLSMDIRDALKATTPPEDDPRSAANVARRRSLSIAERDPQGRLLPGSTLPGAGRRAEGVTVTMLARSHTDIAVALLAKAVVDETQPMAARVTAAQALLDRGWGKAPIQVDVQVRARFDSFLRDVGLAAQWERDHPA